MKHVLIVSFLGLVLMGGCARNAEERRLQGFIDEHVAIVDPLTAKANLTYWDASTTGKSEDYDKLGKLQLEIRQVYSSPKDFALLKKIKESGAVKDAGLARQLDKLYNSYLTNQIPPGLLERIVDADTKVQEKYNTYRGDIDGE